MQVSIIIPIYKVEAYIERCVRSVINQTFTDYEVILVDDASPDKALQIAEKRLQESHIIFQTIKHQENQGLSEARNSGLKIAKGKYVMFIDSDDELSHHNVLSHFNTVIERERVDFVCANHSGIWGENDIRRGAYIKGVSESKLLKEQQILEAVLYTEISVAAWNKLINREFLLNNCLFFLKGLIHEDELWAFQMAIVAESCYCLPDYTYNYYRNNPHSLMANIDKKAYKDKIFIIQEQLKIVSNQQLLNKVDADAFIYHVKRISVEVLRPKVLDNKPQWINYYRQISQIYRHSELYQYKKLFRLPAVIAYFVRKESRKNMVNNGNKFYRKLLAFAHRYNGI